MPRRPGDRQGESLAFFAVKLMLLLKIVIVSAGLRPHRLFAEIRPAARRRTRGFERAYSPLPTTVTAPAFSANRRGASEPTEQEALRAIRGRESRRTAEHPASGKREETPHLYLSKSRKMAAKDRIKAGSRPLRAPARNRRKINDQGFFRPTHDGRNRILSRTAVGESANRQDRFPRTRKQRPRHG